MIEKFKLDINIRSNIGQTPLMIAANFGFIKIAKYLLEHGAEINIIDNN